jgi:hypothetical protein
MHPVPLPACSCLSLAKELLVLLAPLLPAPLSSLSHASTLGDLGLSGLPSRTVLQQLLEQRFALRLAPLEGSVTLGELLDDLQQGLSLRAIAPPILC